MLNAVRFAGKMSRFIGSNFERAEARDINNLWTGVQLNKKGKTIALGGMAAYGGYSLAKRNYQAATDPALAPNTNPEIQENPMAQADQVGYTNPYQHQDPLGMTGDMVFALHNLRNQGYVGGGR